MPAPSLRQPEAPKPKRPTRAQLARWQELEDERLRLSREAKALGKEQAEIEAQLASYVLAQPGKLRRVETCGYELAIVQKPKSVAWLQLFTKEFGLERVEQEKKAAGTVDSFAIRKL